MPVMCPICSNISSNWRTIENFQYLKCTACESIHIDPAVIDEIDRGEFIREYDSSYWLDELNSSKERSYGSSIARVAESILYSRRPIKKYLDIGTGVGFLLDALSYYLPSNSDIFYCIYILRPSIYTQNSHYLSGSMDKLNLTFDAGCCIEVVEHLTPKMLDNLFQQLAKVSKVNSLYIFNTALPSFVENTDPNYMDPLRRGHIISYSISAVSLIANPHGFSIKPIKGKDWAYIAEYESEYNIPPEDRIWTPIPENKDILHDPKLSSLLYILGLESARAYL